MRGVRFGAALWIALGAAACGGGGSDTSPPVAPSTASPSPAAPTAVYAPPPLYPAKEAIAPLVPAVSGSATAFSVSPALPAGLAIDPRSGIVTGTPAAGFAPTDYTVSVTGPGGTTTATLRLGVEPVLAVSRMAVTGTSIHPRLTLDSAALGLDGTVHAVATDLGGLFGAPVAVTTSGGNHVLELATLTAAAIGTRTGRAVVRLCRDVDCTTPLPVPRVLVDYRVRFLSTGSAWPGDTLTPLSPLSGAPDWTTHQGNAAHTGYVPVTVDPDRFDTRWRITVPSIVGGFNGSSNLGTVTTEGGRVFRAAPDSVTARSEHDGSTLWTYSFAGLPYPSSNPPAVSNGVVYIAAGQQTSTFLFALDAADGSVRFRSSMTSQWDNYLAPTVGPSGVYTNAGTYGGLYAFDLQGTPLYFGATAQQSTWTPAVDATAVYAYTGDALRVFHPVTGALVSTIADPDFTSYIYEIGGSAVLGAPQSVFAAAYASRGVNVGPVRNALVHFDLRTNTVDWRIPGVYAATPAYDDGVVYAVNNNPLRLEARAESNGALLWSWTPPASADTEFASEVLLTRNAVFVSTNQSTYAIDRVSRRTMWSYPAAGNLALSRNGVLYISTQAAFGVAETTLTAINLK
ncbi:MAG: hypothetical protein EHM87_22680 [Burkholderiales bacterium]|nr:MAG: hypothetical protein EHM87_22680 [Burkholderiales bacterium]